MALFGEKYGSEVRVLTMGEFSMELCGGTHVTQTGDIGCFTIVSESGIAAGVRRIEAITGMKAFQWLSAHRQQLQGIASLVKADVASVSDKVKAILDQNKALEKSVAQLQSKLSAASMGDLAGQAVKVGDIELVVSKLDGVDAKALRDLVDQVKQKLSNGVVVLAIAGDNKVSLAVGVTKALSNQIKAGELVNYVAQQVGGKGGGRPDMAMAGGSDVDSLPGALDSVQSWIEGRL
jgi:alanyl-tRNA synthetase